MLMKSLQPGCGQSDIKKILIELSPPFISAKSWVIADGRTGQVLFGKGDSDKREIASLTKIMTTYTALQLSYLYHIDLYRTYTKVSEEAASITGTTAGLEVGDKLTLMDLLYGMLLPSGNDAAVAIAEYFGSLIIKKNAKLGSSKTSGTSRNLHMAETQIECSSSEEVFVKEMNRRAKELKLNNTSYLNPHGMHILCNRSTATELAKLSSLAMGDILFRELVRKKAHIAVGYNAAGKEKEFIWENTNKVLGTGGCNGIKTGITETAGPCLVTNIQTKSTCFIIVLLNSKNMEARWSEVKKLREWAIERLKHIEKISKKSKNSKKKILKTFKHI